MATKKELMDWMRKYKAEHCKAISKMNKDELFTEAKNHGFLHEKAGIKKRQNKKTEQKTEQEVKQPASIRNAFPKKKREIKQEAKKPTGKVSKDMIDKIQKRIDELREKAGKIAETKGRVTSEAKKMLDKMKELQKQRLLMMREYKQSLKK